MTTDLACVSGSPAVSDTIITTVNASLPASVTIASSDADNIICAGTEVTFTATPVNDGEGTTYQWYVGKTQVGTDSIAYKTSTLADKDSVTVVMTSDLACVSGSPAVSDTIITTVNATLPASVSIQSNAVNNSICLGTSVTFTASPTNGGPTPSYQWYIGKNTVGTDSTEYTTNALAAGDTVTVRMTSNANCVSGSPATSNNIIPSVNICAPLTQASAIYSILVGATDFEVSWTNGNGSSRVVFVKEMTPAPTGAFDPQPPPPPPSETPSDGTTYTPNTTFGSGTQINTTGWYCVYNGTDTTVTVTGLKPVTEYSVRVFEYNGSGATSHYQPSTATNNPKNVTTIANCANPSGGGSIGTAQSICYGLAPDPFTSKTLPSGQTGTLQYQWQLSTTSDSTGFKNITSADSSYYAAGTLTQSTWFRRITRVGCKANWSDSIKSNSIKVTVYNQFVAGTISSAQSICPGSTPAKLTGTNPTGGKSPYAYQWQSYSDSTSTWSVIASADSLNYQPSALSKTKKYRQIQTSAAGCGTDTTNEVTITVNSLPTLFSVTGGGSYPANGTGKAVGLSGSQFGVKYQLKVAGRDTLSAVRGTGSAISFGLQTSVGSYTVVATDTTTTCTRTMTGSATVSKGAALFHVTGGGSYCEGGSGVTVCLSGSVSGTKYELRHADQDHNIIPMSNYPTLTGTGSAICFGPITEAGTYWIYSKEGSPAVYTQMLDSAKVTVNPLPTAYNVTGGGTYCIG